MLAPEFEKIVCNIEVRETFKYQRLELLQAVWYDGKMTRNTAIRVIH